MVTTRAASCGASLASQATPARGWGRAAAIAAAILVLGLIGTPWTTLWDRDEPRFAQAAVEMAASGQYLYPTFNTQPRVDKPILIYWLMSASIRLLGTSELAARCWAPMGAAFAAFFTFAIGRRLFSARTGLMAMVVLASTPLLLLEGTAATADAVLLAGTTGALAAFVRLRGSRRPAGIGNVAPLALALAVAQLTKGPVGLVVPALAIAGTLWLDRRSALVEERPAGWRRVFLAVAVATAASIGIFLLWAVPADRATGGLFAREGLGVHVLQRMVSPMEGHGGNAVLTLPFYVPVVLAGFFPWTPYLLGAGWALCRGAVGDRTARSLLVSWTVLPFALFSLAATKLPHYVLPIWPALALAVAATLEAARTGALPGPGMAWLRRGVWLAAPVLLLAVTALVGLTVLAPLPGLRTPSIVMALALTGIAIVAARLQIARRPVGAAFTLAGGMIVLHLLSAAWLLPALEPIKPVPHIAAAIRRATPAIVPVFTCFFPEPSLVFYLGRLPVTQLGGEDAVVSWARDRSPGVLVLPREVLSRITGQAGPLPVAEIASAAGLNVAKGQWLELVAVQRAAAR